MKNLNNTLKRYRLIKTYPGSPNLGTIQHINEMWTVLSSTVKNYPEFWEEIIEKDYEILSYYAKNIAGKDDSYVDPGYIWLETSKGSGKWSRNGNMTIPYLSEAISNHRGYGIHSVKRLSDGEI